MTSEEISKIKSAGEVPTKRRSIGLSRRNVVRNSKPFKSPVMPLAACLPNDVTTSPCDTEYRLNVRPTRTSDVSRNIAGAAVVESHVAIDNDGLAKYVDSSKSTPSLVLVTYNRSKTSSTHTTTLTPVSTRSSQCQSTPSSSRKRPNTQRTIFGKKFKTNFKSPLRGSRENESEEQIRRSLDGLKERLQSVDEQIKTLEESGYNLEEVQAHITKLHEYNELKDLGQYVIGQIASKEGTTTKQLYGRFGLELDD